MGQRVEVRLNPAGPPGDHEQYRPALIGPPQGDASAASYLEHPLALDSVAETAVHPSQASPACGNQAGIGGIAGPVVTLADPQHLLTSACYQAAKHLAGIRNSIKQVATSVEVAQ